MAGKNEIPLSHFDRMSGLGLYVHCDTLGYTSNLETIRLLQGF
jgi:hypothetical protein